MLETPVVADPNEVPRLKALTDRLDARGRNARYFLVDAEGTRTELPHALFQVLLTATRELASGRSITILHYDQELTTQQAADILQVSRPYLIRLLDEGKIRHHRVGSHRRIRIGDLLRYKETRDERRRADLKELVRASETLGLYDTEGPNGETRP